MSHEANTIYEEDMAEYEVWHNRPSTFGEATNAFFRACDNLKRLINEPVVKVDDDKIPF